MAGWPLSRLLALAAREAAAEAARSGSKNSKDNSEAIGDLAGMAVNLFGAFTEKADTRNWQTLPHDISYARMYLPSGNQQVTFKTTGLRGSSIEQNFQFDIKPGQVVFETYHTLDSQPSALR